MKPLHTALSLHPPPSQSESIHHDGCCNLQSLKPQREPRAHTQKSIVAIDMYNATICDDLMFTARVHPSCSHVLHLIFTLVMFSFSLQKLFPPKTLIFPPSKTPFFRHSGFHANLHNKTYTSYVTKIYNKFM